MAEYRGSVFVVILAIVANFVEFRLKAGKRRETRKLEIDEMRLADILTYVVEYEQIFLAPVIIPLPIPWL